MKVTGARIIRLGCTEIATAPLDEPHEDEVLVRLLVSSICGSDLHSVYQGFGVSSYPTTVGFPGHEAIGVVEGSGDVGFELGTLVLVLPHPSEARCFADYTIVRANQCVALDRSVPLCLALMAQQLGTVVFALRQVIGTSPPARSTVVIGQGSAGLFFTKLLRHLGAASLVTSDAVPLRRRLSLRAGASDSCEPSRLAATLATIDPAGAGLVIEATGTSAGRAASVELAGDSADLLWFGLPSSTAEVFDYETAFQKRLRLTTTSGAQREVGLVAFHDALQLLMTGQVSLAGWPMAVFPLADVGAALHYAHHPGDESIKVLLLPTDDESMMSRLGGDLRMPPADGHSYRELRM